MTKQITAWKNTTLFVQSDDMNYSGVFFCRHTTNKKSLQYQIFNSLKLFFPLHFRDTKNNISHNFYSFNLTVGLLKMTIFPLLNILSIPIDEDISRTNFGHHTGYFWNFPISHIIQNYWKKQVLLKVFQSQFNCGANTIVKISYLKLPMTLHTYSLEEQTFGAKMATTGKFQST